MITRKVMRVAIALLFVVSPSQVLSAQQPRYDQPDRYDQPGYGQYGRWVYLGEANVDGTVDRDMIQVGQADGRFRALQIRVENAPIRFERVVVHYGNGRQEELQIRSRIPAGGRTRNIDLRGDDRVIQGVEVWYGRANYGSRRPKLRLFGLT